MKHTNHFKKGFTAVELFFVIVVIVALAAFLIPHFMNLKNVKNETAAMQDAANVLSRDLIHAGGALTNMDDVTVENGEEANSTTFPIPTRSKRATRLPITPTPPRIRLPIPRRARARSEPSIMCLESLTASMTPRPTVTL